MPSKSKYKFTQVTSVNYIVFWCSTNYGNRGFRIELPQNFKYRPRHLPTEIIQ